MKIPCGRDGSSCSNTAADWSVLDEAQASGSAAGAPLTEMCATEVDWLNNTRHWGPGQWWDDANVKPRYLNLRVDKYEMGAFPVRVEGISASGLMILTDGPWWGDQAHLDFIREFIEAGNRRLQTGGTGGVDSFTVPPISVPPITVPPITTEIEALEIETTDGGVVLIPSNCSYTPTYLPPGLRYHLTRSLTRPACRTPKRVPLNRAVPCRVPQAACGASRSTRTSITCGAMETQ